MVNSGRRLSPGGVRDSWPKPVGDAAKSKPLSPHAASTVVVQDSRKRTIFDAFVLVLGFRNPALACSNTVIHNYIAIVMLDGRLVCGHSAAP